VPYEESKSIKRVGKLLVVSVLLLFFTMPFHERMQKAYFELVVSGCQKSNELENIVWHEVSAYDAEVRYFYGTNTAEISFTKCVSNWAFFLVEDGIAQIDDYRPEAKTALVRVISGDQFSPPDENYSFKFVRYYGAGSQNSENGQ
jgi:hypothetical protein